MSRSIIVGSAGQDGQLLFDRLHRDRQLVMGIERAAVRVAGNGLSNVVDILDRAQVEAAVKAHQPDRIYYLAAVHRSSQQQEGDPHLLMERSFDIHVRGLLHCLDAMRRFAPQCRLFYAASSHVFGIPLTPVQDESTPFSPICIYGITKTAGAHLCRYYRNAHGVHASVGILYNHESHLRPPQFVSQKIVRAARAIRDGGGSKLILGDLETRIDWGYAPDYVDAMIRILELDQADDFVIATGESHPVREFVEIAFSEAGLDWDDHVILDPSLLAKQRRELVGNPEKLRRRTGWRNSLSFEMMVRHLMHDQERD